jgi:hypothetical protein
MNLLPAAAAILLTSALQAQQVPRPSTSSASSRRASSQSVPDPGLLADNLYRNPTFGFTYKIRYGWVDRTAQMNQAADAPATSTVLLSAFERPPDAAGDSINSSVLIAVEPASAYPGLRNAEHYFGPLSELAKTHGLTVINEPYSVPAGTKQVMRGDFSKPIGSLTMYQSSLVMMQNGYVISFNFIAGSEDEVDQLVESLAFGKSPAAPR